MIKREDVEKMGPTSGCPVCHKQMLGEPLMGVAHTEECRKRHERIMASEGDPILDRAMDRILEQDQDKMRINNAN